MLPAGRDHRLRAHHVGAVIVGKGPQIPALAATWKTGQQPSTPRPTAGSATSPRSCATPSSSSSDRWRASERTAAAPAEKRMIAEPRNPPPPVTRIGFCALHQRRFLAAQTASFSRKILELWRMSTGKEG